MPYAIFAALIGVLLLVTVPQWLVRREFFKLSREHRQIMVNGFEPKGVVRLLLPAVLAMGVVGFISFAKGSVWFAAAFGVLIVGLNFYVAIANVSLARREGFPASFRKVLSLSNTMRVGVLLIGWSILLWSLFENQA